MKNNIFAFMKGFLTGLAALYLGVLLANWVFEKDMAFMKVGECVEEQAMIDGFVGTPREKWVVYSEFCKEFIEKAEYLK